MARNNNSVIPTHIAIIMDGNRRWARKQGLGALYGHEYVSDKVIEPLIDRCIERGIQYVTLWAFSTENWSREPNEVEGLMHLFRKAFQRNAEKLFAKGVRLNAIGDLKRFPEDIQQGVAHWIEKTKTNTKIIVTFALNYGGRDEIIRAVNSISLEQKRFTQEIISQNLDTAAMPDPDLIIRPGGEKRLSGFLTWQSIYAELYFTDVLMPDFSPMELDKALEEYAQRSRRFGK